jgi:hypothetical protein
VKGGQKKVSKIISRYKPKNGKAVIYEIIINTSN